MRRLQHLQGAVRDLAELAKLFTDDDKGQHSVQGGQEQRGVRLHDEQCPDERVQQKEDTACNKTIPCQGRVDETNRVRIEL